MKSNDIQKKLTDAEEQLGRARADLVTAEHSLKLAKAAKIAAQVDEQMEVVGATGRLKTAERDIESARRQVEKISDSLESRAQVVKLMSSRLRETLVDEAQEQRLQAAQDHLKLFARLEGQLRELNTTLREGEECLARIQQAENSLNGLSDRRINSLSALPLLNTDIRQAVHAARENAEALTRAIDRVRTDPYQPQPFTIPADYVPENPTPNVAVNLGRGINLVPSR